MEDMREKYPTAPIHILDSIRRYADDHIPTGGFLTAVLTNDLREALGRADTSSQIGLFDIVRYCHWEIPGNCWGSPEKVEAWLERPGVDVDLMPGQEDPDAEFYPDEVGS